MQARKESKQVFEISDKAIQMNLRDAMLEAFNKELKRMRKANEISEATADYYDRCNIKLIFQLRNDAN